MNGTTDNFIAAYGKYHPNIRLQILLLSRQRQLEVFATSDQALPAVNPFGSIQKGRVCHQAWRKMARWVALCCGRCLCCLLKH